MGSWSSQSPRMTMVIHLCSQTGNILLRGHTVLRKRHSMWSSVGLYMCGWVSSFVMFVCVCVMHAQVCVLCYACTSLCVVCVMHAQVCVLCMHKCVCVCFSCDTTQWKRSTFTVVLDWVLLWPWPIGRQSTPLMCGHWKIAHGKVVSACVLKGSGPLSRPLSLPFPLQVCCLLLFCFILFSVLMNIFLCIHKYYQAGMPIVPSRYHSHRVLLYTNVLSIVVLFLCVYIFSFSAVASSLFLVLWAACDSFVRLKNI